MNYELQKYIDKEKKKGNNLKLIPELKIRVTQNINEKEIEKKNLMICELKKIYRKTKKHERKKKLKLITG